MSEIKPTRPRSVDISPQAIDRCLRDVGQLYKLGMVLCDARPVSKADADRAPKKPRSIDSWLAYSQKASLAIRRLLEKLKRYELIAPNAGGGP